MSGLLLKNIYRAIFSEFEAASFPLTILSFNEFSTSRTGLETPFLCQRKNETEHILRARLLYQSRKRGTLENGLILSSFADKYLNKMDKELLHQYDDLINLPDNDWDIYYWVVGTRPVPQKFNNRTMELLQDHVKNKFKENI